MVSDFVGKLQWIYIPMKILNWIIKGKCVDLNEKFKIELELKLRKVLHNCEAYELAIFYGKGFVETTGSKKHEHFTEPRNKCCVVARQY